MSGFPRGQNNLAVGSLLPGIADPSQVGEQIPREMKVVGDGLKAYSIINERQIRTLYPTTRGEYTLGSSQSLITIPVATDLFLDLPKSTLDFTIKIDNNPGTDEDVALETGWQWIRELKVRVAGQEAERIQDFQQFNDIVKDGSMSKEHADVVYSGWAGDLYDYDVRTSVTAVAFTGVDASDTTVNVSPNLDSRLQEQITEQDEGQQISLPLYCLGLFRCSQYFPNRNVPMELVITTETTRGKYLVQNSNGTNTLPSDLAVKIQDLRMNVEGVVPNQEYADAVSEIIASSGNNPLVIPYETYQNQVVNVNLGTSEANKNFVFNFSSNYLKSIWMVARRSSLVNDISYLKNSYPAVFRSDTSLRVNGKRYPVDPLKNLSDEYQNFLRSFNMKGSVALTNSVNKDEYVYNSHEKIDAGPTVLNHYKAKHIEGWDLEQYNGRYGSLTGMNVGVSYALRVESSMVCAENNGSGSNDLNGDYDVLAFFHYLKMLKIGGNSVQIVEP